MALEIAAVPRSSRTGVAGRHLHAVVARQNCDVPYVSNDANTNYFELLALSTQHNNILDGEG